MYRLLLQMHQCTLSRTYPLQEFQYPDIAEPGILSLEDTLNTKFNSNPSQSENFDQSTSCPRNSAWIDSQESEGNDSLSSSQNRRSTSSFQDGNSSTSLRRRGTGSRRSSAPQSEPSTLSLVLDLLPWLVGLVWLTTSCACGKLFNCN